MHQCSMKIATTAKNKITVCLVCLVWLSLNFNHAGSSYDIGLCKPSGSKDHNCAGLAESRASNTPQNNFGSNHLAPLTSCL